MKTLSTFCVAILAASLVTPAAATTQCYVKGDTSQNNPSKPLGGQQNPYGSLAAVSADTSCETIVVVYSSVVLDGGITLANGQELRGAKGSGGQLPSITNSTAEHQGAGIVLTRDNQLKHLHVLNTQFSGIHGSFQLPPFDFGGDITFENILVTGANQSGTFVPALGAAAPSIFLAAATGANIDIKNSEVGDANVTSIGIYQVAGHGDVRISNTTVRDQGYLSEEYELSPGIAVFAVENSSLDVAIVDTSVSNIGSPFVSNSDGLLLLNRGSGAMTVEVDGYHYSNPDGGGYYASSTGIEMGFFGSTGGGTFDGVVTNSVIENAYVAGIQVLDQDSGGSNSLTAKINDNVITGTWDGIEAVTSQSPYSSMFVDISGNTIATANRFDCGCSLGIIVSAGGGSTNVFDARIEANTIVDTNGVGILFTRTGTVNSLKWDAGLGALGSSGQNRIIGTVGVDIQSNGAPVTAANNWWGSEDGPASVVELNGGTVDVTPFLTEEPKTKKKKN